MRAPAWSMRAPAQPKARPVSSMRAPASPVDSAMTMDARARMVDAGVRIA
jgi:hypothetical protein